MTTEALNIPDQPTEPDHEVLHPMDTFNPDHFETLPLPTEVKDILVIAPLPPNTVELPHSLGLVRSMWNNPRIAKKTS